MTVAPATGNAGALVFPRPTEIQQLQAREEGAWAALFEREYLFVFRNLLAQTGNRAVAEDIAQQVFLEALAGIGRYRDRGKPIRAWLLRIGRNRAHDWYRRGGREEHREVDVPTPGPEEALTPALDAMAALTPDQREVVHLRFVEGYQLEEVAGLTGRSVGAVKSLQHRALDRLRVELDETATRRENR
ncbi:MAG: sigma-70 family RNA polymerase sigma factor [Chloroflexi bacterium]|nr:sigma-70 family RNA polymerase sigma factor [Chloroflexota bacterium]